MRLDVTLLSVKSLYALRHHGIKTLVQLKQCNLVDLSSKLFIDSNVLSEIQSLKVRRII